MRDSFAHFYTSSIHDDDAKLVAVFFKMEKVVGLIGSARPISCCKYILFRIFLPSQSTEKEKNPTKYLTDRSVLSLPLLSQYQNLIFIESRFDVGINAECNFLIFRMQLQPPNRLYMQYLTTIQTI